MKIFLKFSSAALLLRVITAFATNTATSIASGCAANSSLFIESDSSLWTMGDLTGVGENFRPGEIASSNVVAVATGEEYFLFVKADGTVW